MNNYLIPANSKKSLKIFGLFNPFDLILFGSGVGISLLLMIILPLADVSMAIVAIVPAIVTGFLVFPVPYYHNVLTVIIGVWNFFTTQRRFLWKGWCVTNGEEKKE